VFGIGIWFSRRYVGFVALLLAVGLGVFAQQAWSATPLTPHRSTQPTSGGESLAPSKASVAPAFQIRKLAATAANKKAVGEVVGRAFKRPAEPVKGDVLFGAFTGNHLVGAIVLERAGLLNKEGGWTLRDLAVDPNHQGQGIGKALLAQGLKVTKNETVGLVLLNAAANTTARKLYESFGFKYLQEMKDGAFGSYTWIGMMMRNPRRQILSTKLTSLVSTHPKNRFQLTSSEAQPVVIRLEGPGIKQDNRPYWVFKIKAGKNQIAVPALPRAGKFTINIRPAYHLTKTLEEKIHPPKPLRLTITYRPKR
jgi:ribosomal protein S18 acetylase RimI-like enzyme